MGLTMKIQIILADFSVIFCSYFSINFQYFHCKFGVLPFVFLICICCHFLCIYEMHSSILSIQVSKAAMVTYYGRLFHFSLYNRFGFILTFVTILIVALLVSCFLGCAEVEGIISFKKLVSTSSME